MSSLGSAAGSLGRAIDSVLDRLVPASTSAERAEKKVAWWERPLRFAILFYLLIGFPVALGRVFQGSGTDLLYFHGSARYLLEHGLRDPCSRFASYLPSVDAAFITLAWLPLPALAAATYVVGCWSWMGLLRTIHRHLLTGTGPDARRRAILLAGMMVVPLAVDGLCLGAFHIIMVWLMVAGLVRVSQGRAWSGGLLLGLAAWLKLLPLLGVGYLLLKRTWRPATIAVATVVALDVSLSLMAYGPRAAWQAHVKWWHDQGTGTLSRQLAAPGVVDEDRRTNQSLAVILRRLLTHFGMTPDGPRNAVALGNLSATQLRAAYLTAVGALGLALLLRLRHPASRLSPRRWSTEIALVTLATLWFSPLVWSYHPTSVTPGLAIVLSRYPQHRRLAWATACVWLLAMALFAWPLARILGHMMWASLFIGAALVTLERDEQGPGDTQALSPRPASRI